MTKIEKGKITEDSKVKGIDNKNMKKGKKEVINEENEEEIPDGTKKTTKKIVREVNDDGETVTETQTEETIQNTQSGNKKTQKFESTARKVINNVKEERINNVGPKGNELIEDEEEQEEEPEYEKITKETKVIKKVTGKEKPKTITKETKVTKNVNDEKEPITNTKITIGLGECENRLKNTIYSI